MSGIYGKFNSYDEIKNEVKKLTSEKRFIHSEGVAQVAVELARLNNYDEEKAKLCGILHDVAKNFTGEMVNEFITKYNIDVSKYNDFPQLIHGPIGAYYVKNVFEIDDNEIFNAIYYHSTGKPNMNMLEKIIYLSDFLDPNRERDSDDYKETTKMIHDKAYRNIDEGILFIIEKTMVYLEKMYPSKICEDTILTYEFYKNQM